jgi:hypothetical protein
MARVLLVNPPFYRLLGSRYNANSLGIAYIAAVLNKNGHDAWLYKADYKSEREFINLKGLFNQHDSYLKYFEDENNPIWEEVAGNILDFNPDWIGYTCYTANITSIKIISKKKVSYSIQAERAFFTLSSSRLPSFQNQPWWLLAPERRPAQPRPIDPRMRLRLPLPLIKGLPSLLLADTSG